MSEVVPFDVEYRCFCRNGAFFCGSSYPEAPYQPVPEDVREFAERVAKKLLAADGMNMVTVDVGVGEGRLRLVEIGGVNSWGIYGSDVAAFIEAMEAESLTRWRDLAE